MSGMSKQQEASFRDLVGVVARAREGGGFADLLERYSATDRWTTAEREVVREASDYVASILGDESPADPSWRAALALLALFGDGDDPGDGQIFAPAWHGAGRGYFVESLVLGELPKEVRDVFRRFSSHLAWEPKDPRERVREARRKAAAKRKALGLVRHD